MSPGPLLSFAVQERPLTAQNRWTVWRDGRTSRGKLAEGGSPIGRAANRVQSNAERRTLDRRKASDCQRRIGFVVSLTLRAVLGPSELDRVECAVTMADVPMWERRISERIVLLTRPSVAGPRSATVVALRDSLPLPPDGHSTFLHIGDCGPSVGCHDASLCGGIDVTFSQHETADQTVERAVVAARARVDELTGAARHPDPMESCLPAEITIMTLTWGPDSPEGEADAWSHARRMVDAYRVASGALIPSLSSQVSWSSARRRSTDELGAVSRREPDRTDRDFLVLAGVGGYRLTIDDHTDLAHRADVVNCHLSAPVPVRLQGGWHVRE